MIRRVTSPTAPRGSFALRDRLWEWGARRLDGAPRFKQLLLLILTRRRVFVDFPVRRRPRYGHGRPPHPELHDLISARRASYAELLTEFLQLRDALKAIPAEPNEARPDEPAWRNRFLPPLDAMALYAMVRRNDPARYVEIGYGNSTKFARRAIRDGNLRTRITSIDPAPRAEIDGICDRVIRQRLEDTDLGLFSELEAGDVLFMDGSHRVFLDSDGSVFFLEVLPRLASGVIVQIHDIFLPSDYPPGWDTFFAEQYVLAAYLLNGGSRFEILLPDHFVSTQPDLRDIVAPIWTDAGIEDLSREGGSFWMRVT